MKAKDGAERVTYSIRLKPDLLTQLKHMAIDEKKTVGELVEEGIKVLIANREKRKK